MRTPNRSLPLIVHSEQLLISFLFFILSPRWSELGFVCHLSALLRVELTRAASRNCGPPKLPNQDLTRYLQAE